VNASAFLARSRNIPSLIVRLSFRFHETQTGHPSLRLAIVGNGQAKIVHVVFNVR
jgi:hypothetical protein